ncbi:hypothetical protein D3C71_1791660 [compost metagenome]
MAHPFFRDAAEARQLCQDVVVIGQTRSGHLVPRGAPQEHRTTERLAISFRGQVTIAQTKNVQRHKREVA